METRIETLPEPEPVKAQLRQLFSRLEGWAATGEAPAEEGRSGRNPELPSQRRMAAVLGVSRDRTAALYQILRRLVEECDSRGRTGGPRRAADSRPEKGA